MLTRVMSINRGGYSKDFFWRLWMLTIYTNHPGGNLVYENKTIKFDVVGERPAKKYIQIRE